MKIQIKDIQYLREKTGFGIMDCKKELEKANGVVEVAFNLLEERGLQIQEKKAERNSEEGIVYAEVFEETGVILEVSTETDFVARSPEFLEGVKDIAKIIAKGEDDKIDDMVRAMVMKFRENVKLKRYNSLKGLAPFAYMHGNGKYAVLLNLEVKMDSDLLSKDLAMQIIASAPRYISREDISAPEMEVIKNEFLDSLKSDEVISKKPQKVLDKILIGKIEKFYKENCLMDQAYIKDETLTVKEMLNRDYENLSKVKLIDKFYRYEKEEAKLKCACGTNMFID
ncbi:MAG: translation elongation factor Ts [Firmicutes bacterium]|nr:translation elongation factor Ts [Bacillota bacterium]